MSSRADWHEVTFEGHSFLCRQADRHMAIVNPASTGMFVDVLAPNYWLVVDAQNLLMVVMTDKHKQELFNEAGNT